MNTVKIPFTNRLASVLAAGAILTSTYNIFFQDTWLLVFATSLVVMSVVFVYRTLSSKKLRQLNHAFAFVILLWMWCAILAFIQGGMLPLRLAVLEALIYSVLMTYLLWYSKIYLQPFKIAFFMILAYFYYQYLFVGTNGIGILDRDSGAINTAILLSVSVTISVIDYKNNQRISVLPAILIVPIAILSYSRTGLVASIVYLFGILYMGTGTIRSSRIRYTLYIFFTLFLILISFRLREWFIMSAIYDKINSYGMDTTATGRTTIWTSYFQSLSIWNVLLGRAVDASHTIVDEYKNAHNSFLMLHAQTGLLAFIFCWFVLLNLYKYWNSNKFVFFLFVTLIVRCSFDMIYFFHPIDYAFFIFMINPKELCKQQINIKMTIL